MSTHLIHGFSKKLCAFETIHPVLILQILGLIWRNQATNVRQLGRFGSHEFLGDGQLGRQLPASLEGGSHAGVHMAIMFQHMKADGVVFFPRILEALEEMSGRWVRVYLEFSHLDGDGW